MNSEQTTTTNKPEGHRHGGWGRKKFLIPFFVIGGLLVKGLVVMWLWNKLVPDLFHGPSLEYLQALGLMLLTKLLVGFHGFRRFGNHHQFGWRGRMMRMSPEEREKMRAEFHRRTQ